MMVREKGKMHGKNFFPAQPSFEAGFYKVPQQSQPSNPSISFAPSTGFDPTGSYFPCLHISLSKKTKGRKH